MRGGSPRSIAILQEGPGFIVLGDLLRRVWSILHADGWSICLQLVSIVSGHQLVTTTCGHTEVLNFDLDL